MEGLVDSGGGGGGITISLEISDSIPAAAAAFTAARDAALWGSNFGLTGFDPLGGGVGGSALLGGVGFCNGGLAPGAFNGLEVGIGGGTPFFTAPAGGLPKVPAAGSVGTSFFSCETAAAEVPEVVAGGTVVVGDVIVAPGGDVAGVAGLGTTTAVGGEAAVGVEDDEEGVLVSLLWGVRVAGSTREKERWVRPLADWSQA